MSHAIFWRRAIGLFLLTALGCGDDGETKNDGGEGGSSITTTGTAASSTVAATTSATTAATTTTTGQGGGGGEGTGGAPPLPDLLELTGMAMGTDGAQTVTCALSGQMTDLVLDGDDITGFFSGEQLRLVEEGKFAFTFEPFVGGPATVTREAGDEASLVLFGDQPPDAKPYWLELEVLSAVEVAPNEFEGEFRCAPLDMPGNPPDFTTTVEGSFRLAPP